MDGPCHDPLAAARLAQEKHGRILGRNLLDLALRAEVDGRGMLRSAQGGGRTGPNGAFTLALNPQGVERHLRLAAADGGALLHALDVTDSIAGGRLSVDAVYRDQVLNPQSLDWIDGVVACLVDEGTVASDFDRDDYLRGDLPEDVLWSSCHENPFGVAPSQ